MSRDGGRHMRGPANAELRGVLLMAYGSPERPEEIAAYYTHIRGGRAPSPELLEELQSRYAAIGGRSPLPGITARQAAALERRLNEKEDERAPGEEPAGGSAWKVYVGMRHWRPWIADAVQQMAADGVRQAVGLALAPHDSRMSVGAYIEAAQRALEALDAGQRPAMRFVRSWADHPLFVEALARRLRSVLETVPGEWAVLFTAHSLPARILAWNDPYPHELERTCRAVARRLGLDEARWRFAYQSQGRSPEPWLGPSLDEALRRLAADGFRQVVICPVGFVSDHLEVLYDIDIEAAELARRLGVRLMRTPSLNDAPDFIEALAAIVTEAVGASEGVAP